MKNGIKSFFNLLSEKLGIAELVRMQAMDRRLSISRYLNNHLYNNPKYKDSPRLNKFERSIYSQGGDDGIIEEIFNRIGITNHSFVEFGVGDGLQNNTAALLLSGWTGLWMDGGSDNFKKISKNLASFIEKGVLTVKQAMVTVDTVGNLFHENKVLQDIDFLSIDIDGNDYWIWKALTDFTPRAIVLEYNAAYGPTLSVVQKYGEDYFWKRTNFYGASLSALNKLGQSKGYTLVACSFLGNNAYFVRSDLVQDKFRAPFTPEYLYEEHKPFLLQSTKYPVSFIDTVAV